jgi:hypothetical protein
MDFDKYTNRLPYPSLSVTKAALLVELDDVPMTKAQRIEAGQNATNTARARHKEIMDAYNAEERRLHDLFFADAHDELAIAYLPLSVLEKLDKMAWERGHSSGYNEVYSHMCDLAELATLAYGVGMAKEEYNQRKGVYD